MSIGLIRKPSPPKPEVPKVETPAAEPAPPAQQTTGLNMDLIRSNPMATIGFLLGQFGSGYQGRPGPLDQIMAQEQEQARQKQEQAFMRMQVLQQGVDAMRQVAPGERAQVVDLIGGNFESTFPGISKQLQQYGRTIRTSGALMDTFSEFQDELTALGGWDPDTLAQLVSNKGLMSALRTEKDRQLLPRVEKKLQFMAGGFGEVMAQLPGAAQEALMSALSPNKDGTVSITAQELQQLNQQLPPEMALTPAEMGVLRRHAARDRGFAAQYGLDFSDMADEYAQMNMRLEEYAAKQAIKEKFSSRKGYGEPYVDERGNLVQQELTTGKIEILDRAKDEGMQSSIVNPDGTVKTNVSEAIMRGVGTAIHDPTLRGDAIALAEDLLKQGSAMSVGEAIRRAAEILQGEAEEYTPTEGASSAAEEVAPGTTVPPENAPARGEAMMGAIPQAPGETTAAQPADTYMAAQEIIGLIENDQMDAAVEAFQAAPAEVQKLVRQYDESGQKPEPPKEEEPAATVPTTGEQNVRPEVADAVQQISDKMMGGADVLPDLQRLVAAGVSDEELAFIQKRIEQLMKVSQTLAPKEEK